MDYKYFNNKYADELNSEELNWIKNNSYINNYVYFGQKIILEQDLNLENLSSRFSIFSEILTIFNKYKINDDLETLNELVEKIQISYTTVYNNFDEIINNDIFIKEFISMYHIIRFIENNYFRKNNIIRLRWRLWHDYVVRNPNLYSNNRIIIARSIPHAENGDYVTAEKLLDYELQKKFNVENNILVERGGDSPSVFISTMFYKHKLRIFTNDDYDEIFKIFCNRIEKDDMFYRFWCLTKLKISEFYFENYNQTKDLVSFDNYIKWFKLAFKWISDNPIQTVPIPDVYNSGNPLVISKNNLEIIREPILSFALYYYMMNKKA